MNYILLNDPASRHQRLVRLDHISTVEVSKADQSIVLQMLGGQQVTLSHEEAKQFLQYTKGKLHHPETT
jgi:hypothetical protein